MFLHPFILVVVETLNVKEAALVDLGACLNVISHELMQKLCQMSVDSLQTLAQSFTRHTTKFVGKVHPQVKVGELNYLDEFYIMPPREMMNPIILVTPWQRKHRAALEWDEDAIIFKQQDGYAIQPFFQPWELHESKVAQRRVITPIKARKICKRQQFPYTNNQKLQY